MSKKREWEEENKGDPETLKRAIEFIKNSATVEDIKRIESAMSSRRSSIRRQETKDKIQKGIDTNGFYVGENIDISKAPKYGFDFIGAPLFLYLWTYDRSGDYDKEFVKCEWSTDHQAPWVEWLGVEKFDKPELDGDYSEVGGWPDRGDWRCDTHDDPLRCDGKAFVVIPIFYLKRPLESLPVGYTGKALMDNDKDVESIEVNLSVTADGCSMIRDSDNSVIPSDAANNIFFQPTPGSWK